MSISEALSSDHCLRIFPDFSSNYHLSVLGPVT